MSDLSGKSIRGMVLAAGFGTRLLPFTNHLPKPLFPVLGKPLLWYQIKLLLEANINNITVNLHHLSHFIEFYLAGNDFHGVTFNLSPEDEILGTGGGLKNAKSYLADSVTVLLNGDTLLDICLAPLIDHHLKSEASVTLLLERSTDVDDEHAVLIDSGNVVRRIVGYGADTSNLTRCTFMGVHIISPEIFLYLPDNGCIIRKAYIHMIEQGSIRGVLAGSLFGARHIDVGTPASLLKANLELLNTSGRFQFRRSLETDFILSDGMLSETNILGSNNSNLLFAGPGCSFPPGARLNISNSVLSGNNSIGRGARLVSSLVLNGESVQPDEYLENSVAGYGYRVQCL